MLTINIRALETKQYGQLYVIREVSDVENKSAPNSLKVFVLRDGITFPYNIANFDSTAVVKVLDITGKGSFISIPEDCCGWINYGQWSEDFIKLADILSEEYCQKQKATIVDVLSSYKPMEF